MKISLIKPSRCIILATLAFLQLAFRPTAGFNHKHSLRGLVESSNDNNELRALVVAGPDEATPGGATADDGHPDDRALYDLSGSLTNCEYHYQVWNLLHGWQNRGTWCVESNQNSCFLSPIEGSMIEALVFASTEHYVMVDGGNCRVGSCSGRSDLGSSGTCSYKQDVRGSELGGCSDLEFNMYECN